MEEQNRKRIVEVYLKNGYFYKGYLVEKDEKFLHFIDRKTGKLKILNLDVIREMNIDEEVINDK